LANASINATGDCLLGVAQQLAGGLDIADLAGRFGADIAELKLLYSFGQAELSALTTRVNATLAAYSAEFTMSVHFALHRINDARNHPPITTAELEDVFMRFIAQHLAAVLKLRDHETFNIRCTKTHINMSCQVKKYAADPVHNMYVITVMRKQSFFSRDPYDFHVT